MDILFLGTAAAEGWPGMFCKCDACLRARRLGGKEIRTRSSIMIDKKYKIDFPPDTYMHVLKYGLELEKVEHLLITHSHSDHFYPADLKMRQEPFAHFEEGPPLLHIYGDRYVEEGMKASGLFECGEEVCRLVFQRVEGFVPFEAGDMLVTPLKADHYPSKGAFNYLIRTHGITILYGLDTGWFPEETWEFLSTVRLDVAILDCTNGPMPGMKNHMGVGAVVAARERFIEMGSADDSTTFIATHFSHNGGYSHEELERSLSPAGIIVAYDGMCITVE